MTANIREKLLNSDAAKSLRMEARVGKILEEIGWSVRRSNYYTDLETKKMREMDVYASRVFQNKSRTRIGHPIINVDLILECKSLSGQNIIFSKMNRTEIGYRMEMDRWSIGNEEIICDIVRNIIRDYNINSPEIAQKLYKYFMSRAYPNEMNVNQMRMTLPELDILSSAFRETKGGDLNDESQDNNTGKKSPLWSAVQSCLSAVRAIRVRSEKNLRSRVETQDAELIGQEAYYFVPFYFDAELTRSVFNHSIIILNSKLWELSDDDLKEINTARLYVNDTTDSVRNHHIDIVTEAAAEEYLAMLSKHICDEADWNLKNMWRHLKRIDWAPAQNSNLFEEILNPEMSID
jgi:hypothetical protein